MSKENRAHQAPAKGDWPPKSSYVSQATSKMTDEIKELLHDAITVGVQNNRMLKWLVVKRLDDERYFYSADGRKFHYSKLQRMLPDISDILDDVEKK